MPSVNIRRSAVRFGAVAALVAGLTACATPPDYSQEFGAINSRLDTLDMRVQEAISRADAAGQAANTAAAEARTANQRIDALQRMPGRSPRG